MVAVLLVNLDALRTASPYHRCTAPPVSACSRVDSCQWCIVAPPPSDGGGAYTSMYPPSPVRVCCSELITGAARLCCRLPCPFSLSRERRRRASPPHRPREDGLALPPYRPIKNPSCFCVGSAFEVTDFLTQARLRRSHRRRGRRAERVGACARGFSIQLRHLASSKVLLVLNYEVKPNG